MVPPEGGSDGISPSSHSILCQSSRALNVTIIAGTSFGRYGEGYLRLSYANSLPNIAEAISRMEDWLRRQN